MDRRRLGWLTLAGGLLMGLSSGWGLYLWLETQRVAQGGEQPSVHPVVVATRDLARGTRVGPDDVQIIPFPDLSRPEGALASLESSIGRLILEPIHRGEPLLEVKLGPTEIAASPIALRTTLHKRAYPIRVDGLAGNVLIPGDRVDLIATFKPTDGTGSLTEPTSRVVVENVPILDVLRAASPQSTEAPQAETTGEWEGVILEVTPDEAERIALAEHEGTLRAALRHPADTEHTHTPGVSQSRLLGLERPASQTKDTPPSPPPLREQPAPRVEPVRQAAPTQAVAAPSTRVEVIRGGQRSEVTF